MYFFKIFIPIFCVIALSCIEIIPKYDTAIGKMSVISSSEMTLSWETYSMTFHQSTDTANNIWYLGVSKEYAFSDSHDFCASWNVGSETRVSTECLDFDGDDTTDEQYTFPVHFALESRNISFTIHSQKPFSSQDITLYSMNTRPIGNRIVFALPKIQADTKIISRSEWWADETMRYADSGHWKQKYPAYLQYLARPKTQAELDAIYLDKARVDFLKKHFPDTTKTMSLSRYENGHLLVWPIQKVKKVNRIVLHHTAESMESAANDEEVLRAIYRYHTLSRQWGDIGYHYIVGQRGNIYEGRAWGDYVVASHVQYNNMGTIGIATMGNFQKMVLNRDQQNGLEEAIMFVAKKYGITLSDKAPWVHLCNTATCSPLQIFTGSALLGHRDIGSTSCPGDNIHSLIPDLINRLNSIYSPIINKRSGSIDPLPKNEDMNMTLNTASSVKVVPNQDIRISVASTTSKSRYIWKKFKVKLSYPDEKSIALSFLEWESKKISLWSKKILVWTWENIVVWIVWNNRIEVSVGWKKHEWTELKIAGNVVRINSWNRIPTWDSAWRYNDNLFRDTIVLRNNGWKLLVVNELPLEWYLRGLWEVSNGDMPEKIKTITVAARSYAKYYMNPQNRKYDTKLYDGSDDPDSFQKYLGYGYEARSPNVITQVLTTKWLVITYDKKLIKPWYFSSSNGRTLSFVEYCKNAGKTECNDISYLQSVDDPGGYGHNQSGHGVGISWIGATYWSGQWWGYQKIIGYYLPGTKVERK